MKLCCHKFDEPCIYYTLTVKLFHIIINAPGRHHNYKVLLTKPNIHTGLFPLLRFTDPILTQGDLGRGGRRSCISGQAKSIYYSTYDVDYSTN